MRDQTVNSCIEANKEGTLFRLSTPNSSYIISIFNGLPLHYYWGSRLGMPLSAMAAALARPVSADVPPYSVSEDPAEPDWSSAWLRLDFSFPLAGDIRAPALAARSAAGPLADLRLSAWRVYKGRPALPGLPQARAGLEDSQSLELCLSDKLLGIAVKLNYTVFDGSDVVARSLIAENRGSVPVTLEKLPSFSIDLAVDGDLDLIAFDGAWARERQLSRRALGPGILCIGSHTGASGHSSSPAAIVARSGADEDSGEVWSANLVYSGSWAQSFERSDIGLRWIGGISPEGFSWKLDPGQSLAGPEALLCYSGRGLSALSNSWYEFVRSRILPPRWARRERPILINNWEATYFKFNEQKLTAIAKRAAQLGVELFVLDDGWFGKRDDDTTSLGDWTEDRGKLPGGLAELAAGVRALGLKFGFWVEPEAVSPESDLYRTHPNWCLHLSGRPRAPGRHQLVLDLGRKEVRAEIAHRIKAALSSCRPDYIKWDMNRPLALAGSEALDGESQGECRHRYILGLYALMDEITSAFPDTLFEGCAGGGGRLDLGILYYMPQFWTSDDTDAFARAGIQYGTSFFFPPITMGAHVSAVPNHQTKRVTPMTARAAIAFGGNLGYELDPTALSAGDAAAIARDISFYKEHRALIQLGSFYRILPSAASAGPGRGDIAWMSVSLDKTRAILTYMRSSALANPPPVLLRLRGLDPDRLYRFVLRSEPAPAAPGSEAAFLSSIGKLKKPNPGSAALTGQDPAGGSAIAAQAASAPGTAVYSGAELMARGCEFMPGFGDGWTLLADITAENEP